MLHTKFCGNRPLVLEILKVFYHVWAWRPSWSCDSDVANKLSSPLPDGGSTINLALIGQVVMEIFENVDDR